MNSRLFLKKVEKVYKFKTLTDPYLSGAIVVFTVYDDIK